MPNLRDRDDRCNLYVTNNRTVDCKASTDQEIEYNDRLDWPCGMDSLALSVRKECNRSVGRGALSVVKLEAAKNPSLCRCRREMGAELLKSGMSNATLEVHR